MMNKFKTTQLLIFNFQHNKYDVGSGEQFDDLVGLIEHFRSYPMVETSGDMLRLLQPLSGTRLRARDINNKVQEMQVLTPSALFRTNKILHGTNVYRSVAIYNIPEVGAIPWIYNAFILGKWLCGDLNRVIGTQDKLVNKFFGIEHNKNLSDYNYY